ncbi:MAG: hypothetical protein H8E68_02245 [Kiritimatiellaeota bacterium]|nr:hypothetical protein [Kiritimatiellota bacterium]
MECEQKAVCSFYKTEEVLDQPCIVEKLKSIYCEGNSLLCARRRVAHALGHDLVPVDLHPDHTHLVHELLTAGLHED